MMEELTYEDLRERGISTENFTIYKRLRKSGNIVKGFFQRGLKTLPIELPAVKCQE